MKDKWGRLSRRVHHENELDSSEFESVGEDYDRCQALLRRHSSKNYAALNAYLSRCTREWLERFLECDALDVMFNLITEMGSSKSSNFTDTVLELQVITVIKNVLNNTVGMEFLLRQENVVVHLMLGNNSILILSSPVVVVENDFFLRFSRSN